MFILALTIFKQFSLYIIMLAFCVPFFCIHFCLLSIIAPICIPLVLKDIGFSTRRFSKLLHDVNVNHWHFRIEGNEFLIVFTAEGLLGGHGERRRGGFVWRCSGSHAPVYTQFSGQPRHRQPDPVPLIVPGL